MNSPRNWLDPGGSLLRRVDQLRTTLESLGTRLRQTVAEALGKTLGSVVRDAVLSVLEHLVQHLPGPKVTAPRSQHRPQDSWSGLEDEDCDHHDLWPEEVEETAGLGSFPERPPEQHQPRSWVLALTAGLRAASWLLPRSSSRRAWLAGSALTAFVAVVGYLSPAVTTAGLTLIATAQHLGLLSTLLQSLPV